MLSPMRVATFQLIAVALAIVVLSVIVKRTISGHSLPENPILCGIEYLYLKKEAWRLE